MSRSKQSSKKTAKPKLKLKKVDWYGFNHEVVAKKFEGDLTFVNYMNVGEKGDVVAAVYHAAKPNLEKGHKEFLLLWKYYDLGQDKEQWMVSGMTREQIEKHAVVQGMYCVDCDTALWSLNRHHFHKCGCSNETMVDGRKDYNRFGAMSLAKACPVQINLLTDEVLLDLSKKRV